MRLAATSFLGAIVAARIHLRAAESATRFPHGAVIGEPLAAKAGMDVLADGGSLVVTLARGRRVFALDFNSAAPAAMRADNFKPGADGRVRDRVNEFGWLATGVPGTLAGLDAAWRRFGSRPFHQVFWPALAFARDGFTVNAGFADAVRATAAHLARDPSSAKLLLPGGEPPKVGDTFRNPKLAEVFKAFLARKSVRDFYKGDIALRVAEAFEKRGGLVTAGDLARYEAKWPQDEREFFAAVGYTATTGPIARVSAVGFDARTGEARAASR